MTEEDEFTQFMSLFGMIAPSELSRPQLVSVISTLMQEYADPDELEYIADSAVDVVLSTEAALALDLAVGPEDGIN